MNRVCSFSWETSLLIFVTPVMMRGVAMVAGGSVNRAILVVVGGWVAGVEGWRCMEMADGVAVSHQWPKVQTCDLRRERAGKI